MLDILARAMNITERIRNMQELNVIATGLFGVLLVFGIINCILGYRLLRFWMMLFGFGIGAGLGLFGAYRSGTEEKTIYIAAMAAAGVALAIVAFLIFKAGIFILGAGLGLTLSIYLIHPTSSFTFFVCLLIGVGLGVVAMRYEREVIIVGTSLLGGVLTGVSLAKLGGMAEIPYGIGMSAGAAILGTLIQFALNKPKYDDDEDEYEDEDDRRPRRKRELTDEDYLDAEDEDEIIEEYLDNYYGEDKKRRKKAKADNRKEVRRKTDHRKTDHKKLERIKTSRKTEDYNLDDHEDDYIDQDGFEDYFNGNLDLDIPEKTEEEELDLHRRAWEQKKLQASETKSGRRRTHSRED